MKNLILTATNARKNISNFLGNLTRDSVVGLPLGTSDGTATGELAVKVLMTGTAIISGSGFPYNATQQAITNVSAGPNIIVYKDSGGNILKTRTFTYTNGGASTTDVLTNVTDT